MAERPLSPVCLLYWQGMWRKLTMVISFIHEGLHYLAARALGVGAIRRRHAVDVDDYPVWKSVLITLAPSLAALAYLIFMLIITGATQIILFACSGVILLVAVLVSALRDISIVWRLIRHGRPPEDHEGFQGIPWLGIRRYRHDEE